MKNVWETLGIAPTENKREVKKAYAAKLAKFHPEDHPQEFEEIQAAYSSIMDSLNRDYNKQTPVRPDLKDAFKKKDTIYQEDMKTTKKKERSYQFEDEQIHEDIKPKSQDEPSLYDELNLDLSFQKLDKDKAKKTKPTVDYQYEVPLNSQKNKETQHEFELDLQQGELHKKKQVSEEETRTFLSDLYFQKFLERIKYSKSLDMLESLILNETFFKQMEDSFFYKKVSNALVSIVPTLNSVTLSFLYDSFEIIRDHYQYPIDGRDVPTVIRNFQTSKIAKEKRNKLFKTIGAPALIFALVLTQSAISSNDKKQKEEQQERMRDFYNTTEAAKRVEKRDAEYTLDKAIEENLQLPYDCNMDILFLGYGSNNIFYCKYEGNSYTGSVTFDDDGNLTRITGPTLTKSDSDEEVSE